MLWILIVVIVLGGVVAVGSAMRSSRPQLGGGGGQKALPPGSDSAPERTIADLRVDDVVTMDGKDYLCEGVIAYDEDGHRWSGARVADGADIKWLLIGIERAAASSARLLVHDDSVPITGYPPEAIVIGEVRYVLDKRGAATCQLFGELGSLGALKKDRPQGHVERCRWWLYSAPGDDTLVVEQWGSDYRLLRGKRVVDGTIELMPGS